jgi:hypothetical protein
MGTVASTRPSHKGALVHVGRFNIDTTGVVVAHGVTLNVNFMHIWCNNYMQQIMFHSLFATVALT